MLCGIDLPRVDIVLLTRPFSHISSIVQAAGRGGRLLSDGSRRKVAIFLLYNLTDVKPNAKNMTSDVRKLYLQNTCIKKELFAHFSDGKDYLAKTEDWCCNFH